MLERLLCIYALPLLFLTIGVNAQKISATPSVVDNKKQDAAFPSASQFANGEITYKIIPAANKTWCYNILTDGKMMIHKPSAPGLPGNEGFKTKAAAQKVVDLVI